MIETFLCSACGGSNVLRDATVAWSIESKMWELASVQDQAYCEDCDGETTLVRVREIEDE